MPKKIPEETVNKIVESLHDYTKSTIDIAKACGVSEWFVGECMRKYLPRVIWKERVGYRCRMYKIGESNPMFGKTGNRHHNAVFGVCRTNGYKTVFTPDWWQGPHDGRIYEHHFVWAEYFGQANIPSGCVIHHIDLNKDNNDITNLQLLTISEHMKLHAQIRKEQRLSRKRVGGSAPEAHSTQ